MSDLVFLPGSVWYHDWPCNCGGEHAERRRLHMRPLPHMCQSHSPTVSTQQRAVPAGKYALHTIHVDGIPVTLTWRWEDVNPG